MQGLTPTFTLTLHSEVDLTEAQNIYVTFRQGDTIMTKVPGSEDNRIICMSAVL